MQTLYLQFFPVFIEVGACTSSVFANPIDCAQVPACEVVRQLVWTELISANLAVVLVVDGLYTDVPFFLVFVALGARTAPWLWPGSGVAAGAGPGAIAGAVVDTSAKFDGVVDASAEFEGVVDAGRKLEGVVNVGAEFEGVVDAGAEFEGASGAGSWTDASSGIDAAAEAKRSKL